MEASNTINTKPKYEENLTTPYPLDKKPSIQYRYYALSLLWLVALFRFVDLQIFAVLLEPIKAEFNFTDTQLALIGGLAFALFYALLGIPIAWAADRFNRRNIIACAVCIWSLMTVLCGLSIGFVSLFLARVGVGIGEAGAYPPTTSLLSDYFPPQQRGRVFAILASAIPVGVFVGFLVGGIVNEHYGWRSAFQFVGIPGIVLALLVQFTLKELPRGYSEQRISNNKAELPKTAISSNETFKATIKALYQLKSYRYLLLAASIATLGAAGSGVWIPSYFIRHHGLSTAEIGLWLAILYGAGGLIGAISGGALSQYFMDRSNDYASYMKVCSYSTLAILPFAPLVFLLSNPTLALCTHFFICILIHMNIGPVLTMVQSLAGIKHRAMAQAINVLVTNIIALTFGPLLVGMASDLFSPVYGSKALGIAILILMILAYGSAAFLFRLAGKNLSKDIDAVNANL